MEKKAYIIDAALTLLVDRGLHNTPMSAIAKAAGTGMGTIYNYFPNKEILINEIYQTIKEKEAALFSSVGESGPIKIQFESFFKVAVTFFIENPRYFQFMEQVQASPIITEETRAEGQKALTSVMRLLNRGKEERIIKDIEVSELFMFIGGAILSYVRWILSERKNTSRALDNQLRMVWDAIKA